MRPVQARHDALLRTAVEEQGGIVVKSTGDGLHAAFETAAFLPWVAYSRLLIMLEMDLEPELAQQEYDKVVSILRQSHSSRMAAMAESDWGHKMRHEGNFEEALAIYRRMLVEWRELGHRAAMANILENIAFVDRVQGRPERGVILLGAAERIREAIGQDMLRLEREEYERELAELKSRVAPQELDSLWANGRTMSTDAIIAMALQERDSAGT
jgi:class 3 adenylate cyclase